MGTAAPLRLGTCAAYPEKILRVAAFDGLGRVCHLPAALRLGLASPASWIVPIANPAKTSLDWKPVART